MSRLLMVRPARRTPQDPKFGTARITWDRRRLACKRTRAPSSQPCRRDDCGPR